MTSQDPFDAYPLAPFLASLGDDFPLGLRDYERISLALRSGGPWSLDQLRGVLVSLVVREETQEDAFRRRFDRFFDTLPAPPSAVGVKERVLADLRQRREAAPKEVEGKRSSPDRRRRLLTAVAVVVIVVGLGLVFWPKSAPPEVPEPPTTTAPSTTIPTTTSVPPTPQTIEVPTLVAEPVPDSGAGKDWQGPAGMAALFLLTLVGYGGYLGWTRRPPRDAPDPDPDPALPRLFDPGTIGGTPAPRLNEETLDVLADSLGYFRSEAPSRKLDVAATVVATGKNAGLPSFVFERRKQVRRVVLLEDAEAASLDWNPIVAELAAGLLRRGVPVVHGRFHGVPDRFRTADGELHLEDLEDELGDLVLIFSDGKGLRPGKTHQIRYRRVFDILAHWPMVAWMEPREPRAWDAATAVPAGFGVPVYPASPDGLVKALGRFLTERAPQSDLPEPRDWRGLPPRRPEMGLGVHVERLLGDALLWAQAAAMAMPPVAAGLVDALRRRFHPDLPPERFDRLVALPGTTTGAGGLRFSKPVLAVLRQGFAVRRDREEQEEVLRFLLERIREAEPAEKESAAHRAWEWRLERVRLELDPDAALQRLSQIASGTLGEAIRGELADATLRGEDAVPLRKRPESRQGLQRLWSLNEDVGLRREEVRPPVSRQQAGSLLGLGLGFAAFLGMAFLAVDRGEVRSLHLEGADGATVRYFDARGWIDWDPGYEDGFPRDVEARIAVLRNGIGTTVTIPADSQSYKLVLGSEPKPCQEDLTPGLRVFRCPENGSRTSWRETLDSLSDETLAPGRLLSVGLEVRLTPSADDRCPLLLAGRSVDVCFRLVGTSDREATAAAVEQIDHEVSPWVRNAQLVWWIVEASSKSRYLYEPVDGFVNSFDRSLLLTIADFEGRLEPAPGKSRIAVMNEQALADYGDKTLRGKGDPIYLFFAAPEAAAMPSQKPTAVDAGSLFPRPAEKLLEGVVPADSEGALQALTRILGTNDEKLLERVVSAGPEEAFLASSRLVGTDDARLLAQLRKRKNPFDVLEGGLTSVSRDEAESVLRVAKLLLPLVEEDPYDPVRLASTVWALDYAMALNPILKKMEPTLRDRVLKPLRERSQPPEISTKDWVEIPAGTFLMGSPESEGYDDERPQHEVSLPAFRMLRHEVTIGEYRRLSPNRTSLSDNDLPITGINWYDAYTYAAWIGGRLPTEAEWEYAARAGCRFEYCDRDGNVATADDVAWTLENSGRTPQSVMQREPNPWGLYDMLGNLWEWTTDGYAPYADTVRRAPWVPATSGDRRVIRGGGCRSAASMARVELRSKLSDVRSDNLGFRVVLPDEP